jgi:hypothetical protein
MILFFGGEIAPGGYGVGDFFRPWEAVGAGASEELTVATIRLPVGGILRNMTLGVVNGGVIGVTPFDVAARVNQSNTSLACSAPVGVNSSDEDTINEVVVSSGDNVAVIVLSAATLDVAAIWATIQLDAD